MLGNYLIAREGKLPPIPTGAWFEYVLAGNGLFVRAEREEFEAMVLAAACEVKGLPEISPYLKMKYGKVPLSCVGAALDSFRNDLPNESLIWFSQQRGIYRSSYPAQVSGIDFVRPLDPFDPEGTLAFMDIHSHGALWPARFSQRDDEDESSGLRLYAVVGNIAGDAEIAARVIIMGHAGQVRPSEIMELPPGVREVGGGP